MSLGNNSVNHNDSFYYSYSCCDHHRLILVLVIWFSILLFIISVFLLSSSSSSSAATSNKNDTSTTGSVVPMNTTKRDKKHSTFDCNDIDDTSNVTADTSLLDEVYEVSGTMSSITSDNGFVNKETIRSSMSLSSSIGQEIQNTIEVSLDEVFMKQQQQQHDKHDSSSCTVQKPFLVHNGELKLHIRNGRLEDAIERIQHLVQDNKKGYIETKTVYTIGDYNANDNFQPTPLQLYGTFLTIRIQNDDYFSVFRHVQKNLFNDDDEIQFGLRVIQYTTNTKDVTDKYIDASARANVLHVSREALLRQLVFINNNNNNASTTTNSNFDAITTVSDVLYIQSEINQLTEQIESQRLRAKYYEKQSLYSTLHIQIDEVQYEPKQHYNDNTPNRHFHTIFSGHFKPIQTIRVVMIHLYFLLTVIGNVGTILIVTLAPVLLVYYVIVVGYLSSLMVVANK